MLRRTSILFVCLAACGGGGDDDMHMVDAAPPAPPSYDLIGIEGGLAYTVKITIGGSQTFDLDIDTGSTTLGVAASNCSTCAVSPKYTPGATAIDQHTTSMAMYGDGTGWSAENYSDTVALMGDTDVSLKFGAISTQNGFFRGIEMEGIIGFAAQAIASPGTDAFVAKRVAGGDNGTFAFQFCPDNGKLWMNGYDVAATAGDMELSPMVPLSLAQPFYEVNLTSGAIDTTSVSLTGPAVVDTGTSVMVVSSTVESKIFAAINGSAGFKSIFPGATLNETSCLTTTKTHAEIDAALPKLTMVIPAKGGGTPITLAMPATQSYLFDIPGMGLCAGIAAANGLPTILGDAILRGFITQFDTVGKTIGFAPQKGCDFSKEMQKPEAPPTGKPPTWFIRPEWRSHLVHPRDAT